ncbi:hypothetical protein EBB79_01310 [Parasedimentitalea marina]|uniref:PH domain-containing protein n=1 Tax=Parasedimentitalea marina TaxID=2483033 RepID=A0A3T0N8D2_9RHOB|nr:hypothetical protein EBB79_01310 [Parasedimentitalea marina]
MQDHVPLQLEEGEQRVQIIRGRVSPTISDLALIVLFSPTLMLVIWLSLHRLFRPVAYILTTQRVLVMEPQNVVGEIAIKDIQRIRTLRKAMMIQSPSSRLWLSRLPDAWQFEATLEKIRQL